MRRSASWVIHRFCGIKYISNINILPKFISIDFRVDRSLAINKLCLRTIPASWLRMQYFDRHLWIFHTCYWCYQRRDLLCWHIGNSISSTALMYVWIYSNFSPWKYKSHNKSPPASNEIWFDMHYRNHISLYNIYDDYIWTAYSANISSRACWRPGPPFLV